MVTYISFMNRKLFCSEHTISSNNMVFMIHRIPPGVLCLAVEPSGQGRRETVGCPPEESHREDRSDRSERVGSVQTEEQKALERQCCSLSVLQECIKERRTSILLSAGPVVNRTKVVGLN